jgi:hypothetical protein
MLFCTLAHHEHIKNAIKALTTSNKSLTKQLNNNNVFYQR